MIEALWRRLGLPPWRPGRPPPEPLPVARLRSLDDWNGRHPPGVYERRLDAEARLVPPAGEAFSVEGYCWPDRAWRRLHADFLYGGTTTGARQPNWRERLVCRRCGLNNRQRAALHVFEEVLRPSRGDQVYITEQVTPLHAWLRARYTRLVGSEFVSDSAVPGRSGAGGVRHEDLTRLSFPDASLDFVLSFDVFEHVPDYGRAFAECARVLREGGRLLFSVPFVAESEAVIVRATRAADGTVTHRLPAEYHGDPLRPGEGVLCYQHFGWRMLDELEERGFRRAEALAFHSFDYGYLGGESLLFLAVR